MNAQQTIKALDKLHGALLLQADRSRSTASKSELAMYAEAVHEASVSLKKKSAPEKDEIISHLQIMHTWADYAAGHGMLLNAKEIRRIADWSLEASDFLK